MKFIYLLFPLAFIYFFGAKKSPIDASAKYSFTNKSVSLSNHDILVKAILNKRSVTCYYKHLLRKMTPHVIGMKNGTEHVLSMQYDGESERGLSTDLRQNWRCMFVENIENLVINNDDFYTADNHSQMQSCVDVVDTEVDY